MHAHPHPNRSGFEPQPGSLCARDRVLSRGEHAEERVTLSIDLDTAVCVHSCPDHGAVVLKRVRVTLAAQLVKQPRRARNIREQERCGAAG
jgi:hypothetical protein